jgi:hypothetical protein
VDRAYAVWNLYRILVWKNEVKWVKHHDFWVLFSLVNCLQVIWVTSGGSARSGRVSTRTCGDGSLSSWPHMSNKMWTEAIILVLCILQTCVVIGNLRIPYKEWRFWGFLIASFWKRLCHLERGTSNWGITMSDIDLCFKLHSASGLRINKMSSFGVSIQILSWVLITHVLSCVFQCTLETAVTIQKLIKLRKELQRVKVETLTTLHLNYL